MKLNEFEAQQLALLILSGVPPIDAVAPFISSEAGEGALEKAAVELPRQQLVLKAIQDLSGGVPWQKLRPEERLQIALDKHYAEMAYFMWTHNYTDLSGVDKVKADTCRAALEAKLAGTAGKGSILDRFYEEVIATQRARIKVGKA